MSAARAQAPALSGFLNIDKPPDMTSFDVVRVVRRAARLRRVGHAGTLDRPATGVLPIALGPSTRLIDTLMDARKRYRATVTLGVETDTYDAAGEVQARCDASGVTRAEVEDALEAFRGDLLQTPPAFSAVKLDGERAWRAARRGEQPQLEPRPVTVYDLTLGACEPPELEIEVECSKGFYMRSLAHDLGESLGVGGHLASLSRTAVGPFRLEDAVALDDAVLMLEGGLSDEVVHAPDAVLHEWPAVILGKRSIAMARQGRDVRPRPIDGRPPARVGVKARGYGAHGKLVALLECGPIPGVWHPYRVFAE
ncbi:MAG: tRNA pseudouridine(55) synthase TruB [Chloroflexi bacterium]|nr:tRNA pseudouridine(55) synthase TruB [Chloroflexota bacterium]